MFQPALYVKSVTSFAFRAVSQNSIFSIKCTSIKIECLKLSRNENQGLLIPLVARHTELIIHIERDTFLSALKEGGEVLQGRPHLPKNSLSMSMMSGETKTVIKGNSSKYVKLNVGGSLHYTTIGTLTKQDTMLRAMFSGRMEVLTDSEGWILIDRNGKYFGQILNFLRDGSIPLPETRRELHELLQEAKYYLVQDLVALIEQALKNMDLAINLMCKVPLITSSKEEQHLLASSTKPVVKLICNRHNNKYSYTSNSDDNLLKNLELFDKLSLRFNRRVVFIKDVIGSNEICCWSFFGHGSKTSEVCCTSIVYGTDKKHTKVEFPEARIFEETLNVLLYENRDTRPDEGLMQATRGYTVDVHGYHSDEDVDEKLERKDRLRRK